ncbi:MAG: hypothetical protein NTZ49_04105 [Candidatus Parcubacteria bacterium]|nr:hypothetical protein [Candidatus Parcubacteria bacterium]
MKIRILQFIFFFSFLLLAAVQPVLAANLNNIELSPMVRLLREFSVFLNIILIILIFILALSIKAAFKNIKEEKGWKNKAKLLLYILSKDPTFLFSQKATRDKNGTYMISFDKYRKFQDLSRHTIFQALGLIIIKVFIFAFLIYGISYLAHFTSASENKLLESNNFILQLDK